MFSAYFLSNVQSGQENVSKKYPLDRDDYSFTESQSVSAIGNLDKPAQRSMREGA